MATLSWQGKTLGRLSSMPNFPKLTRRAEATSLRMKAASIDKLFQIRKTMDQPGLKSPHYKTLISTQTRNFRALLNTFLRPIASVESVRHPTLTVYGTGGRACAPRSAHQNQLTLHLFAGRPSKPNTRVNSEHHVCKRRPERAVFLVGKRATRHT